MQAIGVIPGRREVSLIEHIAPELSAPDQVKVRSLDVGICGTDKEICSFVYGSPPPGFDYLVLGHESLGEVVEVGSGVSDLKPGDLVVPSVRRPCAHHECLPCRSRLQDFCSTGDFTERGIKMTHGFLTEHYVEDAKYLTFVPRALREIGVLVEPLTVAEKAMAQVWRLQERLPWVNPKHAQNGRGTGLRAVVLGAGPVGILGAMKLKAAGFETFVYSRSPAPNPKSDLVESFGAKYICAQECSPEALAERVGNIDLVYEAVGAARISFEVMKFLGMNGIFVFTGIPAPNPPIGIDADIIMRNQVLKNQIVVGTVNADGSAFQEAINDLGVFLERWPESIRALISGRHPLKSYRELLLGHKGGIKNIITFE